MKFECDSCHAQYMIADEKVGKRGVKVKCKKCQHVIIVRPDKSAAAEKAAAEKAEREKPADKSAPKIQPPVERPVPTEASPAPPGLEAVTGNSDGGPEGDAFAGGPTDPSVPSMQAQQGMDASGESDPFASSGESPENTGPSRKLPAP